MPAPVIAQSFPYFVEVEKVKSINGAPAAVARPSLFAITLIMVPNLNQFSTLRKIPSGLHFADARQARKAPYVTAAIIVCKSAPRLNVHYTVL